MNKILLHLREIGTFLLNVLFYAILALLLYLLLIVFCFSSFKIPTGSMIPTIIPGDYVLVNKMAYGARLFDIFKASDGERVPIYRMPGYTHPRRNDVVVFHIPHPHSWNRIEMDLSKYFIKRCIALPGDTLSIVHGKYVVNGDTTQAWGYLPAQEKLSRTGLTQIPEGVVHTFPGDSILGWNIKDFGPLYIPKKGETLTLDRTHSLLYRKIIAWELQRDIIFRDGSLWDGENRIKEFTFRHNYLFMGGDRVMDSQDSRYWGLLPDDLVVGKAITVWKSVDPMTEKIRRERVFKRIR